ncbi:unnamed protein product, partial [Ilex paraguariensis]
RNYQERDVPVERDVQLRKSQAGGSFTVTRDTSGELLGKGTKITLYLKEDQLEYLEECRLRDLIMKNSEFINYPISLWIGVHQLPKAQGFEFDNGFGFEFYSGFEFEFERGFECSTASTSTTILASNSKASSRWQIRQDRLP